MAFNPGDVLADRFTIVRELGRGGNGIVFEVIDEKLNATRALKVLISHHAADPKARDRFVRESKAAASIASDYVVRIYDYGVDQNDAPWLCMELLRGMTLEEHVHQHGALPFDEALKLVVHLGHALSAAHAQGVLHLDLKPANLFLAVPQKVEAVKELKVLDFGLAHTIQAGRSHVQMTTQAGTLAWMPPEQHNPRVKLRETADVYPLGLIAFWMLTGKNYWRTLSAHDMAIDGFALMKELAQGARESATARARELGIERRLPDGFDGWFARCLSEDTSARWKNGAEATHALEDLLARASDVYVPPSTVHTTVESASPHTPAGFTVPIQPSRPREHVASVERSSTDANACVACGKTLTLWNRGFFTKKCAECLGSLAPNEPCPTNLRIAGAMLLAREVIMLALVAMSATSPRGQRVEASGGIGDIFIVIIGATLLAGKARYQKVAIVLIILNMIISIARPFLHSTMFPDSVSDVSGVVIESVVNLCGWASILVLLFGRPSRARILGAVTTLAIVLILEIVGGILIATDDAPATQSAALRQPDVAAVASTELVGRARPWRVALPGGHWSLLSDESARELNPLADRWATWNTKDAHVMVIVERRAQGDNMTVEAAVDAVIGNTRGAITNFALLENSPLLAASVGRLLHFRGTIDGQQIEYLEGVFVGHDCLYQVMTWTLASHYSTIEVELREIVSSFELPNS
jgi:serine/threonine protein kinase